MTTETVDWTTVDPDRFGSDDISLALMWRMDDLNAEVQGNAVPAIQDGSGVDAETLEAIECQLAQVLRLLEAVGVEVDK